jgi:hypothetical protein
VRDHRIAQAYRFPVAGRASRLLADCGSRTSEITLIRGRNNQGLLEAAKEAVGFVDPGSFVPRSISVSDAAISKRHEIAVPFQCARLECARPIAQSAGS